MNTLLWSVQITLAVVFAASGVAKGVASKDWLLKSGQTGLEHFDLPFIRFIAVSELLGSAGLVLPWSTGVARFLTPLAAACLAVIMAGAARAHGQLAREYRHVDKRRRKEWTNLAVAAALGIACVLVAAGRFASLRGAID